LRKWGFGRIRLSFYLSIKRLRQFNSLYPAVSRDSNPVSTKYESNKLPQFVATPDFGLPVMKMFSFPLCVFLSTPFAPPGSCISLCVLVYVIVLFIHGSLNAWLWTKNRQGVVRKWSLFILRYFLALSGIDWGKARNNSIEIISLQVSNLTSIHLSMDL
jgi:hypothetical protein